MARARVRHNRRSFRSLEILAAAGFAAVLPVRALAQVSWIRGAGTGDWNLASNWSPAQVPGANITAEFVNEDGASRTINYNYTGPAVTLGEVRIDQIGTGTNTLSIPAGSLSAREINIGFDGRGILKQTGGTTNANIEIEVGYNPGSAGEYDMSGGKLTTPELDIGFGSSGTFNHTGGTVMLSSSLSVGAQASATSSYNLSGAGSLTVPILSVSGAGLAGFQQDGGTSNFTDSVILGEFDGRGAAGLSGGTMTVNKMYLGRSAGSTGFFIQTGGTMTASAVSVGYGDTGEVDVFGGTFNATQLTVGDQTSGLFDHEGGTVNLQYLYLARVTPSVTGTYTMSGNARLNITGTAYVGSTATGTFDQAGGTHTAAALVIGSAGGKGTYTLRRGGVLNVTGTEDVGYGNSDGTFNQTEGTHTADTINVGNGDFGTATGHFTLTGPSALTVTGGGVYVGRDGGTGTFTHSGGTHVTTLLAVGSGHNPTRDSQGSYFFGSSATLTVNSSETIGDDGGTGLFSQDSGAHTIKGASGLRLAVGSIVSNGTFQLSGGMLTTPTTQVGLQGLATFKHTGGTHTVNGDLTIALAPSARGSYALSGSGTLITTNTILGGHGGTSSFTQSGGTHTATAALKILSDSTGYTLSGGRLVTPLVQTDAAFNVSGGTADVGEVAGAGIVTTTGGQLNASDLRISTFSDSNTAHVTVLPSGGAVSGTSQFNKLTIAGGATFDLSDNAALVDYATTSPLPSLRDAILRASQAGWTGPGLTSSSIVIHPNAAVGYAEASDALGLTGVQTAPFAGKTADASTVLVRYTLAGDANLDRRVDFSDLVRLAQNYNTNVAASGDGWWSRGDFTYDGITDFSDLVKLAQNYNTALPSAPIPGASAAFQSDLAAAFALVPEPTGPAILFLTSAVLTRRRKKPRSA